MISLKRRLRRVALSLFLPKRILAPGLQCHMRKGSESAVEGGDVGEMSIERPHWFWTAWHPVAISSLEEDKESEETETGRRYPNCQHTVGPWRGLPEGTLSIFWAACLGLEPIWKMLTCLIWAFHNKTNLITTTNVKGIGKGSCTCHCQLGVAYKVGFRKKDSISIQTPGVHFR